MRLNSKVKWNKLIKWIRCEDSNEIRNKKLNRDEMKVRSSKFDKVNDWKLNKKKYNLIASRLQCLVSWCVSISLTTHQWWSVLLRADTVKPNGNWLKCYYIEFVAKSKAKIFILKFINAIIHKISHIFPICPTVLIHFFF